MAVAWGVGGWRLLNRCLQRENTAAIGKRRMRNWRERAKAVGGTPQFDSWKPFKVCCTEIPQTWHYWYEEVVDKGLSFIHPSYQKSVLSLRSLISQFTYWRSVLWLKDQRWWVSSASLFPRRQLYHLLAWKCQVLFLIYRDLRLKGGVGRQGFLSQHVEGFCSAEAI